MMGSRTVIAHHSVDGDRDGDGAAGQKHTREGTRDVGGARVLRHGGGKCVNRLFKGVIGLI